MLSVREIQTASTDRLYKWITDPVCTENDEEEIARELDKRDFYADQDVH